MSLLVWADWSVYVAVVLYCISLSHTTVLLLLHVHMVQICLPLCFSLSHLVCGLFLPGPGVLLGYLTERVLRLGHRERKNLLRFRRPKEFCDFVNKED